MARILVAEDQPDLLRTIKELLEQQGHGVQTALNAAEALTRMKQNQPDILVTDDEMLPMSGSELIATMRRDPALADLMVVLLTKRSSGAGLEGFFKMNEMHMSKPFCPAQLLAFVKRIVLAQEER